MNRKLAWLVCLLLLPLLAFGYLYEQADLMVIGYGLPSAEIYKGDGYLEVAVELKAPAWLVGLLARVIKVEGVAFEDRSYQFTCDNQLYAVLEQQKENGIRLATPPDETTRLQQGKTLSDYGLFRHRGGTEAVQRFYLYYGLINTGENASQVSPMVSPVEIDLSYSVLGIRRAAPLISWF